MIDSPPARRGEDIGPHVEHRQEEVAPRRVGRRNDNRFFGEIQPRKGVERGVERIEFDTHDEFQIARGIRRRIRESVHRPL